MAYCKRVVDESTGEGLFATEKIVKGTVIIKTTQCLPSIDKQSSEILCSSCYTQSPVLKRCSKCKKVKYCSAKCQKKHWKLHKHECSYLCNVPEQISIPPLIRTCALLSANKQLKSDFKIKSLMKHDDIIDDDKKAYYPYHLKGIMKLLGNLDCSYDEIFDVFCRVLINSFSLENTELQTIGTVLIPEIAKMNHSCKPNCVLSFRGSTACVIAISDIKCGQELCISYIPLPSSFLSRQQTLKQQFNFACACKLCSSQLQLGSDNMVIEECAHCKLHDHPKITKLGDMACKKCGNSFLKEKHNGHVTDVVLHNIKHLNLEVSSRNQLNVNIINALMDETEKFILEEKYEAALTYGLRATVGLMEWAQSYPSTGMFLAKVAKLYRIQQTSSSQEFCENLNAAIQLLDAALLCLTVSLGKHDLVGQVKALYDETKQDLEMIRGDLY